MDLLLPVRIVVFLLGVGVVIATLASVIRSFVLPRGAQDRLTHLVFLVSRFIFDLRMSRCRSYQQQDRVMAYYAPITLLALPVVWLALIVAAFTVMFWAVAGKGLQEGFIISGSSVMTLGFVSGPTLLDKILSFSEAGFGLLLVALLIAYLPVMYTTWATRETGVSMLEVYAGPSASPVRLILRFHSIGASGEYQDFWNAWITWFAQVAESHTSLAPLVYFRSPRGNRSWIKAAGTVMDMGALVASTLDLPREPLAEVTVRSGYLAVRQIADLFNIPYDPDPLPTDPISIPRSQFDHAYLMLAHAGVPVKADVDQAWRDFAGWRVTYDAALLGLMKLTVSPPEEWFPETPRRKEILQYYGVDVDMPEDQLEAAWAVRKQVHSGDSTPMTAESD